MEFETSKIFTTTEALDYVPNSVVLKTILRKTTGKISLMAFDAGETLTERVSPFDTFIQALDGDAEILIDDVAYLLKTGQSIIIPAHAKHIIKATLRVKILSTVIKSGYEELV